MSASRRLQSYRTEGFLDLSDAAGLLGGRRLWVLARCQGQVQPDADFIPAASRDLYTPMFRAIAMSVTERPALKSFTASSALSRADGLRPMQRFSAFALGEPVRRVISLTDLRLILCSGMNCVYALGG